MIGLQCSIPPVSKLFSLQHPTTIKPPSILLESLHNIFLTCAFYLVLYIGYPPN